MESEHRPLHFKIGTLGLSLIEEILAEGTVESGPDLNFGTSGEEHLFLFPQGRQHSCRRLDYLAKK